MRAKTCVTDFVFALTESTVLKNKMRFCLLKKILPSQSQMRVGFRRRIWIKNHTKDYVEGVIKLI